MSLFVLMQMCAQISVIYVSTAFAAGGGASNQLKKTTGTVSTQQPSETRPTAQVPAKPAAQPSGQPVTNVGVKKNDLASIRKEFDTIVNTDIDDMSLPQLKRVEEILGLLKTLSPMDNRLNFFGEGKEGTCLRYPKIKERIMKREIEELLKKPNVANKAWNDEVKSRLNDLYNLLDYFLKTCGYKDNAGNLDPEVEKVIIGDKYRKLENQYKKIMGQK